MSTISGNDGEFDLDSTVVGSIIEFGIEESAATERKDVMGDAWQGQGVGKKSWSGSMTVLYDRADAGQNAVVIGAEGTANFYPEGNASTKEKMSGAIVVTNVGHAQNQDDRVRQTFQFTGNGALTRSTIS